MKIRLKQLSDNKLKKLIISLKNKMNILLPFIKYELSDDIKKHIALKTNCGIFYLKDVSNDLIREKMKIEFCKNSTYMSNYKLISLSKDQPEDLQLMSVKYKPHTILYIKNPTQEVIKIAPFYRKIDDNMKLDSIKADSGNADYILDFTEEMQEYLIERSMSYIDNVGEISEKLQLKIIPEIIKKTFSSNIGNLFNSLLSYNKLSKKILDLIIDSYFSKLSSYDNAILFLCQQNFDYNMTTINVIMDYVSEKYYMKLKENLEFFESVD